MSCAADGCTAEGTKRCGRCATVAYCSADCQRRHWTSHKAGCRPTAGFCCPRVLEAMEEARKRVGQEPAPDLERELARLQGPGGPGASEVDLSQNELGMAAMERLCRALGATAAAAVRRLVLEECRLDVETAAVLARHLPALTQLQVLSLAHNHLEVGGAESVVSGLRAGVRAGLKLQELSLADNLLGPRAAMSVAELMVELLEAESLVSVSLAENFMQEEGGEFLSSKLCGSKGTQGSLHLDLSANDLRVAGAKSLVPLVAGCPALGSLELHGNRIHDFGAVALAQALKSNSTLGHLGLAENLIGDDGAVALAGMLSKNRSLRTLDLCGGQGQVIRDKGAMALADALLCNDTLEGLELDGNGIAGDGGQALQAALETNQSLTSLTLRGNQFDYTSLESLMASRTKHTSL